MGITTGIFLSNVSLVQNLAKCWNNYVGLTLSIYPQYLAATVINCSKSYALPQEDDTGRLLEYVIYIVNTARTILHSTASTPPGKSNVVLNKALLAA